MDPAHTAASEQSEAGNLIVKPVEILNNPNLPQASPTSLLIKNKPIFLHIMVAYFNIITRAMPGNPSECIIQFNRNSASTIAA